MKAKRVSAKHAFVAQSRAVSENATITTYEFRLYPTTKQVAKITTTLRMLCTLANAALEERIRAYHSVKTSPNYYFEADRKREWVSTPKTPSVGEIRADSPAYGDLPFCIMREAIKRVDLAFAGFFRRVALGQTPGFARYKSVKSYDSMTFSQWTQAVSSTRRMAPRAPKYW
jgi:putative transposase